MSSLEQLGFTFQPQRRIFTVRDLVGTVRTALEREYTDIWIGGEISNYRPADSGHLYFTLKDGDAQLRVVMFRMQARLLRFRPENGMEIIARGRITVYESRGELQLIAEYLEPKGAGALQIAFEQLKAKLAAEGLFDSARKKPVPVLPRCIGVVTSPRGAAIHDILNVLRRRHATARLLIFPAQVQGEAAASEVAAGIRYFNKSGKADVIIVARGGGSLEDLAAFNDEGLARTIFSSVLPVISAIGHETDFTIADFVADMRAPTPSAAAELVISARQQLEQQIESLARRLEHGVRYRLMLDRQRFQELSEHRAVLRITDAIRRRQQRLDDLAARIAAAEKDRLQALRRRLELASVRVRHHDLRRIFQGMQKDLRTISAQLPRAMRSMLLSRRARWEQWNARLGSLSPLNILERGYAVVFDAAGKPITDSANASAGDQLKIRLAKGGIDASVLRTSK
ncbi:MAG: exodeoxyribonuclease VII large subunit [Acidobacteria bacterium]|nr:exodeoxyribonuclease VII large subunit [Acidobacteriota bacterium]MBV9145359.1 exodeoxyribonuclease VII large subunit [Acidobacteriota bacterium]MBV9437071.1 exodeoxyribonuclease VII large subunit [Acidobacteriota bacterium]